MPPLTDTTVPWDLLADRLDGELYDDATHRILYATDASVYRELPRAVAVPRSEADVVACIRFAAEHRLPVTPRAGGTSLAGQAVGAGLVVDVSKHLRKIVEIRPGEGYATVQPGVVRDQLNAALAPLGYWFGPNTSTANRCTLGGMFGNNSCGSTSISAGTTRDHVIGARVVTADGELHALGELAPKIAQAPPAGFLANGQRYLGELLSDGQTREQIRAAFPRPEVTRRNTGYALDALLDQEGEPYNLLPLLAGSEGTLAFTTLLRVRILPLPPGGATLAAVHFGTIDAAMRAAQIAMRHQPFMCEVMDDTILRLARTNAAQAKNASFVHGDPRAILMVEFRAETNAKAQELAQAMERELLAHTATAGAKTATVFLRNPGEVAKAWALRAAGLGILGNMVGDAKAVACIEDTAVAVADLADYIEEIEALMRGYRQRTVYYAHAGAGEIHLRPVLNLKLTEDREAFYHITRDVARLVKKYRGSLSGEHGDGRVRAAFLEDMLGPEVYDYLVGLKAAFDPHQLLNPGKIVHAPPMNEGLRYAADQATPSYSTALDWSADEGLLRAAEKCNGSGDCRKLDGGAMCPSFRATLNEKDSTRGRANALREVLTRNQHEDPFASPVLAEALDLCLSCKACTSECPSSVDMTNLKAEYLYQRGDWSLRSALVSRNEWLYGMGSAAPRLGNLLLGATGAVAKRFLGVAPGRSLPKFPKQTLRKWFERRPAVPAGGKGRVYLFGDEFVNLQDPHVGRATVELLERIGYTVIWPRHATSGRAHLSKGFLDEARERADENVTLLSGLVSQEEPLIGMEPSAILGFRDEYPKLLRGEQAERAKVLAGHTYTLDEFLFSEFSRGHLTAADFGERAVRLVLHVHCHEKALGDPAKCAAALSLPKNFAVTLLDSGCCGMAGSFGYETEHFELSKRIAEQSLLRHLRGLDEEVIVVANGTSCRHQVKDLLGRRCLTTAEVLMMSYTGG